MAFGSDSGSRANLSSYLSILVALGGFSFSNSTPAVRADGSEAASASSQANGTMYWVCTWGNTNSTMYISDEFAGGTFTGNQVGPTELVPPFQKFVITKFGATPHVGVASCIYKFSESDAQTYLQQRISKPPSGMHIVQTGWKYGVTATEGAAPAMQVASAPSATAATASGAASIQSESTSPVSTNVTVRLVDAVNSSTDPAGKRYRAVVAKPATAGSVQIPENTLASIILAQQSGEMFSAQLVSLELSGQDVAVSSTAVAANSVAQQAQQAAKKIGGFLSSLGKQNAAANQATVAISTAGSHIMIPPGTSLTFSASVPQPGVSAMNAPPPQSAMPASGSNLQPNSNPAGSVALCDVGGTDGKHYISEIFSAGNYQHADLEIAYGNYLTKKYANGNLVGRSMCSIVSQARAQTMLQQWKKDYATHGVAYVETGWSYSGPESGPLKSAQATPGFVLCTTSSGSDKKAYASAIFKAGSDEEHLVIEQAFLKYLVTTFSSNVSHNTSCMKNRYLEDPQRYLYAMKNQAPGNGIKVIETGWTYQGAEPVTAANSGGGDANPEASAGGQYVLCYSDANQSPLYLSANFHIEVPLPPGAQSSHTDNGRSAKALGDLKSEFLLSLQKQYGYHSHSSFPAYCDGHPNPGDPDAQRQLLHQRFSHAKIIETGWKPGAAPPPAKADAAGAPADPYSSVGGVYTGTYTCAKGPVDMKLKLSLNESSILTGTMTFYLPPGSHTKAYTFSLGGPLNQTSGSFTLRPMKWETEAPPNYVLVGFIGTVNPQSGRMSGKVDYSGCGNFEAMKGRED